MTSRAAWAAAFYDATYHVLPHQGVVWQVAFSPDGSRVATASQDGTAKVWDARTGKLLGTADGHDGPVWAVAFSADGKKLFTGASIGPIRVWDGVTASALGQIPAPVEWPWARRPVLARTPDGKTLLVTNGLNNLIYLFDPDTGRRNGRIAAAARDGSQRLRALALSDDGEFFGATSDGEPAQLWRVRDGESGPVWQSADISGTDAAVAISTAARFFVQLRWNQVHILDLGSGQLVRVLEEGSRCTTAAFCPDGRILAVADSSGEIKLWDPSDGRLEARLLGHSGLVDSLAVSRDGKTLASGSDDGTARIWNLQEVRKRTGAAPEVVQVFGDRPTLAVEAGHEGPIRALAYSADGRWLASAGEDNTIRLWDTATGAERLCIRASSIQRLSVSSDNHWLVADDRSWVRWVWSLPTGAFIRSFPIVTGEPGRDLNEVLLPSADGTIVVCAERPREDGAHSHEWLFYRTKPDDYSAPLARLPLVGHSRTMVSAAFSDDGSLLATGSDDSTARVWNPRTGACLQLMAVQPTTHLTESLRGLWTILGHDCDAINAEAFSPDRKWLVTAHRLDTARIWDIATGKQIRVLRPGLGSVNHVAFSSDGRLLMTACDGGVGLWDARTVTVHSV